MAGPGKYVVEHSMIGGGHFKGEVVEFTKDHIDKAGVDIDRLLHLGAIRKAKDEDGEATKYGESTADVPRVFPAVPYDSNVMGEVPSPQVTTGANEPPPSLTTPGDTKTESVSTTESRTKK